MISGDKYSVVPTGIEKIVCSRFYIIIKIFTWLVVEVKI
jgi:hypothetical protein